MACLQNSEAVCWARSYRRQAARSNCRDAMRASCEKCLHFCESRVRPFVFYLDVPLSGSRMAGLADHSLSSRIGVQLTSLLSEPRGEPDRYFGLEKIEKKETMGRVLNPLFTRSLRYLRY